MAMDGAWLSGVEWRPDGQDRIRGLLPNGMDALVWRTDDGGIGYSAGLQTGVTRDRGLVALCNWLACEARAGKLGARR